MSTEQVKSFMEEVKSNKNLQEKLGALPTDNMEEAISQGLKIANEAGFDFSKEDFLTYNTQNVQETELSNSDLEQVSGGGTYTTYTNSDMYKCTGHV